MDVSDLREDSLCPFCGTDTNSFNVCKGCGAAQRYHYRELHYSLISLLIWSAIAVALLYFNVSVRHGVFGFVEDELRGGGATVLAYAVMSIYYIFLLVSLYAVVDMIREIGKGSFAPELKWKRSK